MGNSEVGHMNIGAGRVVYQDITRIDKSIEDGEFFKNEAFKTAMEKLSDDNALHLVGLLSNGGVHSSINHLFALIDMAKKLNVKNVYIHAITDGRDTSITSGLGFIEDLENVSPAMFILLLECFFWKQCINRRLELKAAFSGAVS